MTVKPSSVLHPTVKLLKKKTPGQISERCTHTPVDLLVCKAACPDIQEIKNLESRSLAPLFEY